MRLNKSFFNNLKWVIFFKGLIEFAYLYIISSDFSEFPNILNIYKYVVTWLSLFVSYKFVDKIICRKSSRASTLILYIVYLFSYIPGISLWALSDLSNLFFVYFNIYWFLILGFMLLYSKVNMPSVNVRINGLIKMRVFYSIFFVSSLFGLYYSYRYSGFRIHLNLLTVYDIRSIAKANTASTLEGLLYYIVSTVVFPLYAIYFYIKKKWSGFGIAVLLQLLMFSVAGHKFYFFIIPVGIVSYHFYNSKLMKYIPRLVNMLIIGGILEELIVNSKYIISYFVRRMLYTPARISSNYFDFFISNSPIYFAQDKLLSRLGATSPYNVRVSMLIGELYGNGGNANTGMFGDAFANLGIYSVVIFPAIFLIAMVLFDLITNHLPNGYIMTVLVSVVIVLINAELSGIFYNFIFPMSVLSLFIYDIPNRGDKECSCLL